MANNKAQLLISAVDQTRGAFDSIKRHLGDLGNAARSIKGLLGTLGLAVSAASLGALVKSSLDSADSLSKLSQRVGITVESLSTLIPVAELSGISAEKCEGGLRKLATRMLEAATGSDDAVRSFAAVGVAFQNQDGSLRATDQILLDLADRFKNLPDGAEKTAMAVKLFGQSGADLIPFLNQGRDGIEALSEELIALGLQLGGDTAIQAEVFNDALVKIRMTVSAIGHRIIEAFLPAMNDMALGMVESAKQGGSLREVLDGILLMLKTLALALALALGVATVGKAFIALGKAIGSSLAAAATALSGDLQGAQAIMADLKGDLVNQLDELARFRDTLFEPQSRSVVVPSPAIVAESTSIVKQLTPDDRSAKRAARARLALARTQADTELKLLKSSLESQARALDLALKNRLVSISAYFATKTDIEIRELDAERARDRTQLAEQQRFANRATDESERLKASIEITKIEAELIELNQRRATLGQTNARASAQAERELADALTQAREALAQLTGQTTARDRTAAIERSYQDLKARLLVEGDADGIALIDQLINVKAAQSNLAALEAEWHLVSERLRNAQEAIAIQQQSGLLTEAQAREQIVLLQQQSATEMERLLPSLQQAAEAIGPDAVVRVQAWRNELERTRLTTDELAPLWNGIGESFGSALNTMINSAQTWRSALISLFQKVADAFVQQLVIQPFQQWIAMQARMLAIKPGFIQQEQRMDAAASSAKVGQKSAETTAVVSMDAAKAGAGAAASQASIPYVGPVLAVAAMIAMVAAVRGLLGNVKKFASGGLVTGQGTSTSDSIPACLSAGEFVMNATAVKRVGVDLLQSLNGLSQGPHVSCNAWAFSAGGLVPEAPPQAASQGQAVRIVNVVDPAMAADYLNSSSGEKTILNILQRNAGAVRQLLS